VVCRRDNEAVVKVPAVLRVVLAVLLLPLLLVAAVRDLAGQIT